MHHETVTSDEIREATRAQEEQWKKGLDDVLYRTAGETDEKPGPTGRFPDGQLTENDEGELRMMIGVLKGKVVLNFGAPVASIGMAPEQARQLANSLLNQVRLIKSTPAAYATSKKDRRPRRH